MAWSGASRRAWWVGAGRWPPEAHFGPLDRWSRGCRECGGTAGHRQEPVAREAAALAASRGVEVFWTFCESHAGEIPFRVVAQLLRAAHRRGDLDGEAARARVREQVPDADPQDLLLLDDLLGIADPDVPLPQVDPDARRRRLTALINTASLARTDPALYIIEDAHWIDAVSESMLADFLTVDPAHPVDGADHLPPRIPGRVGAGARRADDCAWPHWVIRTPRR